MSSAKSTERLPISTDPIQSTLREPFDKGLYIHYSLRSEYLGSILMAKQIWHVYWFLRHLLWLGIQLQWIFPGKLMHFQSDKPVNSVWLFFWRGEFFPTLKGNQTFFFFFFFFFFVFLFLFFLLEWTPFQMLFHSIIHCKICTVDSRYLDLAYYE